MPVGWFVIEPPTQGANTIVARKAMAALIGEMPMRGTLSAAGKKALVNAAGAHPYVGAMTLAGQKAIVNMAAIQENSGLFAVSGKKALASFSQDVFYGAATITAAKAIAALTGSQVLYGNMGIVVQKAAANLIGIEEFNGTFVLNAQKASMAAAGSQDFLGAMTIAAKKAIVAGAGSGAAAPQFSQASTFTTGSTNQATWDCTCVLSNVVAGSTIVLMCVVPGAGGAFDINNSNYNYTITDANGSPTWTKRNWVANNNGSSNGGAILFTAQNVNSGTHTIRLQQTVNNGSWVSVPMLCAISVINVTTVTARETRGIYPGNTGQGSLSAAITAGSNSLVVLGVGTDAVQQSAIVNGTSRVAGGSNNTSGYYVFDFGMIITATGPNPTISAATNNQYHGWCAVELS